MKKFQLWFQKLLNFRMRILIIDHSATVVHRADKLATNFEKKVWQSVEAEQMQKSGRLFVKIRPLYRVVKHLYLHSTVWLDRIFFFNFIKFLILIL